MNTFYPTKVTFFRRIESGSNTVYDRVSTISYSLSEIPKPGKLIVQKGYLLEIVEVAEVPDVAQYIATAVIRNNDRMHPSKVLSVAA